MMSTPNNRSDRYGYSILATLAAATAFSVLSATPSHARNEVRCYGVALAGENEGLDDRRAQGTSKVDYQGNAWIMEDPAKCVRIALPVQPDGTPRRGALEPLERDSGS